MLCISLSKSRQFILAAFCYFNMTTKKEIRKQLYDFIVSKGVGLKYGDFKQIKKILQGYCEASSEDPEKPLENIPYRKHKKKTKMKKKPRVEVKVWRDF